MFKRLQHITLTLLVAGLTVLGLTGLVLVGSAAAAANAAPPAVEQAHGGVGEGGGRHREEVLAAAAQALGMTVDEVQTQLRAGESLADLADDAGVDVQTVLDAMDAARLQAIRDEIAAAVADGDMPQAQADWLLEGLDAGYWGPEGGFGFGPRGPRFLGPRHGGGQPPVPTVDTPTNNS